MSDESPPPAAADARPPDEALPVHGFITRMPGPVVFVTVALLYYAFARHVTFVLDPVTVGAGFWPSAGVMVSALLLLPTRRWGWVVAAVVVAEAGNNLLLGYPLLPTSLWVAGNVAEGLVGASLVRAFSHRYGVVVPLRNLVRFLVLAVMVAPLVGASIGTMGSIIATGNPFVDVWTKYVVGDALGVLVMAPALLSWSIGSRATRRGRVETAVIVVVIGLVPLLAFQNWHTSWDVALPYLVTPMLTWAALRYGMRGASVAVLWIALVANVATIAGYGPFASGANSVSGHSLTLLQVVLALSAVTAYVLAALVEDLADRREVERSLWRQAHHDQLTGLPNRALLERRVAEALERQADGSGGVALVVCDLDDFKVVNDGLGHQAGDAVLVEVARRLRAAVREGDVVARLGADEFVVVVEAADDDVLARLTDRLLRVIPDPHVLDDGQQVVVGVTIGVATSNGGHDAEGLLRDADATLYHAKRQGRGRAEHFDAQVRVDVLDRLALPQALRAGLSADELFCLHQPEIELASGQVFGFESLVRWQHPERGLMSPDRFVPLAETSGLAGRLFEHVLEQSLVAQGRWATTLGFRPAICVNLSPYQLRDRLLPATVALALTRAAAPVDGLWLEITESAIADAGATSTLHELRDLGVRLAIDDFGTGWSSLARLSEFPCDLLKIDRSFIAPLAAGNHAEHLVRATIQMAHALGIPTVAEGIETEQQLELLTHLGCDVGQGYLFARPLLASLAISDVAADGHWTGPGITERNRAGR